MLRLYDPDARAAKEIRPGPLRIEVHGADRRVHVLADLLRRLAERRGRRVVVGHSGEVPSWDPAELNVQPMDWPPSGADLHVAAEAGDDSTDEATGRRVLVASSPASWPGADPVSVRLALLSAHYRTPIEAGGGAAPALAGGRLERWRALVAEWAGSPGRPMCADYVAAAEAAFDDDLDTPAVLSLLDRLADDREIPPGSKFETFVHLDLILALDLVGAIGRARK
jgi:hypothetical protein